MQIRRYEVHDLDAVLTLSIRAWAPVFASLEAVMNPAVFGHFYPDWRVNQRDAVAAVCADEKIKLWVAQVDDAVAGFVAVKTHPDGLGEIYMIAVDPNYQRRGIAAALTEVALDGMRSAGLAVAMVETGGDPGHAPARHSY
jgi:ribosomal protein S18 acetylase RimI-like enzyme